MISIPVHYEYDYTANARIASFKEVFTAEEMYASPDHVFAESIIYIAELFGFDPSEEASDIVWQIIEDHADVDFDSELVYKAAQFIDDEILVCYEIGSLSEKGFTDEEEGVFIFSDENKMYCIFCSADGNPDADEVQADEIKERLAKQAQFFVPNVESIRLEPEYE